MNGRKRHILVDTLGLPIACRVEPANISDRRAGFLLLGGLDPLFPDIRTVIADSGHESRKLARQILRDNGWKLQIVKRRQRAFKINEYAVQTPETTIDITSIRIMLNRLARA